MARVTDGLLEQELGLTLDRYQEVMRLCCSAFNGLRRTDKAENCDCDAIWTQSDRDTLAVAIAQAEEMRIAELGYFLAPKYISKEVHQDVESPLSLNRKLLQFVGTQVIEDIQLGVPLELSTMGVINDPVIITLASTVSADQVIVTYHDETVTLHPSRIKSDGVNIEIQIPRCRLMTVEAMNAADAPLYIDDANFIDEVDVKRLYYSAVGAYEVYNNLSSCTGGDTLPGDTYDTMYAEVYNARLSLVNLYRADYDAVTGWTRSMQRCYKPDRIEVNYVSGRNNSIHTELTTASLAHTLLPGSYSSRKDLCGCWVPDILPSDPKIVTPYGVTAGAVKAWMSDSRAKIGFGGKFPSMR